MKIKAVGAYSAKQPLEPMDITRREPGPHDVKIEIAYCSPLQTYQVRINLPHFPTPVALYGTSPFSAKYAPPPRRNRRRPPAQNWRHPAL